LPLPPGHTPIERLFDPEEAGIRLIPNIGTLYQTARGHIPEYRNFDTAARTLNFTKKRVFRNKVFTDIYQLPS
jgi:hypothetical protein